MSTHPPSAPVAARPFPRWLLPAVIVAGVLLHLPSLGAGFYADDHLHQLCLEGKLPLRPWELYDFGGTADWAHLQNEVGGFPWWTSPDWSIRFFRPLASLSLWLDHRLWGDAAVLYHATSLAWLAALLAVAFALFRALGMTRGVATGAVALLAASQATVFPTDWIANRNSLLAAVFTAAAATAIASHARLGRGRATAAALVLATIASLTKESGLVAFGVVAAHLVTADPGPDTKRARRTAGLAVGCAVAWVAALALAGYGTRSGFYATPWNDPGRFAANLGTLGAVGSLALLSPFPPDLAFLLPDAVPTLVAVSLAVVLPVAAWIARRLRGDRTALFLAAWTGMALVPEAGAPVSERLLLTATIGASGLLALHLSRVLPASAGRSRLERAAAWALLLSAGGLEACATLGQSFVHAENGRTLARRALETDVGPASLGRREILLLQTDDPLLTFSLPGAWAFRTRDTDLRFLALQSGRRGLRWTRPDARTMEFESLDRPFVTDPFEIVHRSGVTPPALGETFRLPGLSVDVVATDADGGVRRVRIRWDAPPDGPAFRFVLPVGGRLTHVEPPAVGETRDLPQAPKSHPFVP